MSLGPEHRGEQGVVAVLKVGVERQVVRGERDVVLEQELQPRLAGGRSMASGRFFQKNQYVRGGQVPAPAAIARSNSSRPAETPVATPVTSSRPGTWRPLGP